VRIPGGTWSVSTTMPLSAHCYDVVSSSTARRSSLTCPTSTTSSTTSPRTARQHDCPWQSSLSRSHLPRRQRRRRRQLQQLSTSPLLHPLPSQQLTAHQVGLYAGFWMSSKWPHFRQLKVFSTSKCCCSDVSKRPEYRVYIRLIFEGREYSFAAVHQSTRHCL